MSFKYKRKFIPKLVLTWVVVVFLVFLLVGMRRETVMASYYPTYPREGEPIFTKIAVSNLRPDPRRFSVTVYSDGVKLTEWRTEIKGTAEFMFITQADDLLGQSKRFYIEAVNLDDDQRHEAYLMIPPFPPETLSSFVSFASFSTTLMTTMQSFAYYQGVVMPQGGLNVGLAASMTLISLLIFQELSDPSYGRVGRRLLELRRRYGTYVVVLLIIFFCMVFTRIALILWG